MNKKATISYTNTPFLRMIYSIIFILLGVWVGLSAILFLFQEKIIYLPYQNLVAEPTDIGLAYEAVTFTTADNKKLTGWFIGHPTDKATLLFLHGNTGNISHCLDSLQIFHDLSWAVFIFDYRGYGESEGTPSEQGTYLDAKAAFEYLTKIRKISAQDVIIFGRSLGGVIAAKLASEQTAKGTILESTFTSIDAMAKVRFPYLPVRWLTRISYPAIDYVKKIKSPLLVVHSQEDEIVPYRLGRALFAAANSDKYWLEINGLHNYGFIDNRADYMAGLESFLNTL